MYKWVFSRFESKDYEDRHINATDIIKGCIMEKFGCHPEF